MSSATLEQIEDLKGANFELDLDKPLLENPVIFLANSNEISTEILIEKYARGDETTIEEVQRRTAESLALVEVLSPKGLEQLILSCRAVPKAKIDSRRQPVLWCCSKFGLIPWLYQKARAPPQASPPIRTPLLHFPFLAPQSNPL